MAIYIYITEKLRNILCGCRLYIDIPHQKIKKYFMYIWIVKKYMRLSFHRLILYLLCLLKELGFIWIIRSHLRFST